ncbi:MAG: hypothetical protein RM368_36935 [Nostoc sp. DedSLP03]|uniref:hypothetical protein n=1 Tax=Nostoc sp. DedSLP03 TaxID=3075400 RepID=UPI002AD31256|nr:hypothetical protein [Nostoc sp. DedSLP03]MDZ7970427.1 hypothetical protein [Nostoc sp. DedSLP03]MDZ7970452.1 hypothetical protein [Nostoc sp. DedSLP03]
MADKLDLTPEKVRIKDSYRERIFAESQQLGKSYLETLYFIIDCYFAFRKGAFPTQQVAFTPNNTEDNKLTSMTQEPSIIENQEDSDDQTFTLDFEL